MRSAKKTAKERLKDLSVSDESQSSHGFSSIHNPQSAIRNRVAEAFRHIAFALILGCVAGRAFISEMPFRRSPIQVSQLAAHAYDGDTPAVSPVNWQELARAGFAVALLAAGAIWLLAGACEGQLRVRYWPMGALIAAFAAWSFASAWQASDARSAWLVWAEQFALLTAAFVTIQLCASRRRLVLLVVVLAVVGATLAVKGLAQVGWERAEGIAFFEMYGAEQLAKMGLQPGDPKAVAYAQRIYSSTPTGYFGLANVLAAGLAVTLTATLGLAGAKLFYSRQQRKNDGALPAGELRPATIAAFLTVLLALPIAAVLVLTRSRGGIGATALVLLATILGLRFRAILARRWKAAMLTAGVMLVLSIAAVTAYGLVKDRLPGKTMAIRWFYWTGSAQIVRERPWLGVGPGNFSQAYLRVRRPEAEEAVKTPHNVIAHATTQYGLPGGALYLAVIAGMLILAWKPRREDRGQSIRDQRTRETAKTHFAQRTSHLTLGIVAAMVLFCRCVFGGAGEQPILILMEGIVPTVVLVGAMVLARWFGGPVEQLPERAIRAMRIGLAVGASAFVLHNFVSFGLWTPGTAGLFWLAIAGAVAAGDLYSEGINRERSEQGRTQTTKQNRFRFRYWFLSLLGAGGVIAAGVVFVRPVALRLYATSEAAQAVLRHDPYKATQAIQRAAAVDPLDAYAAMNVARFRLIPSFLRGTPGRWDERILLGDLRIAIRRDPDNAGAYRLAAEMMRDMRNPTAGAFWAQTVERDPANARLRLEYAAWLIQNGQRRFGGEQIDEAERIDRRLRAFDPQSVYLFGERERKTINELQKKMR